MKRIFIAGFESFRGLYDTPSRFVAEKIGSETYQRIFLSEDWKIDSFIMPLDRTAVDYQTLSYRIHHDKPDAVLIFGAALKSAVISVEEVVYNRFISTEKHLDEYETIDPQQSKNHTYWCTINTELIVRTLRAKEIPAQSSLYPGLFYCNFAAYTIARIIHRHRPETRFGLIHIPLTPGEVARNPRYKESPSLSKEKMIQAAEIICELA